MPTEFHCGLKGDRCATFPQIYNEGGQNQKPSGNIARPIVGTRLQLLQTGQRRSPLLMTNSSVSVDFTCSINAEKSKSLASKIS
ncbi:MAG: hypothetical protein HC799_00430 [Limnothrix sp. RL_2_0]|nr:hypothetical protein [Limnothrix sp. RL_2_0]